MWLWSCVFVSVLLISECEGAPKQDSCLNVHGDMVPNGEEYFATPDPCNKCICQNGNPMFCVSVNCIKPTCAKYEMHPDKCCEYTCKDDGQDLLRQLRSLQRLQRRRLHHCEGHNGDRIPNGQKFKPDETDPCLQCTCINGKAKRCMTAECQAPPNCKWEPKPGECCAFICTDRCHNDRGVEVKLGDVYSPITADPCFKCICTQGRADNCATATCDEPPCRDAESIPGTCCGFKCPQSGEEIPQMPPVQRCISDDGSVTSHGETYLPKVEDPCSICICDYGLASNCTAVTCTRPTCPLFEQVKGVCCEFKCIG